MENTLGIHIIPENDVERVAALKHYHILDTPSEQMFDNLVALACQLFEMPVGLMTLVDSDRVFFKTMYGADGVVYYERENNICSFVVLKAETVVIEDATRDSRVKTNPAVAGPAHIRFYAGAPLMSKDGYAIGSFCVVDTKPRHFDEKSRALLESLAAMAMERMEARLQNLEKNNRQEFILHKLLAGERLTALYQGLQQPRQQLSALSLPAEMEELSITESNFLQMMEQAPAGIAIYRGKEFIIELANKKILNIWSRTAESIIGQPLFNALPEMQGQGFEELLNKVLETGKRFVAPELPVKLMRNNRLESAWMNFIYEAVRDTAGSITGIIMMCLDVTMQVKDRQKTESLNEELTTTNARLAGINEELVSLNKELANSQAAQNQLMEQLRMSEANLLLAMESGNMGTWSMETDTGFIILSERSSQLLGFVPGTIVSQEMLLDAVLPECRTGMAESLEQKLKEAQNIDDCFPILQWVTGEKRWIRVTGKPTTDAAGHPLHYSGMLMDITDQKQNEERKNDFIGIVSHELKTPLTSISGYTELLQFRAAETGDDFSGSLLEKAYAQVKKMTAMINSFLNVSRLESGKLEVNKSNFLLDELIRESIEDVNIIQVKHRIGFMCDQPLPIFADRDKIGNVIANLLSNAIKYSPGGKEVVIRCEIVDHFVRVSIQDEGIGIRPEDRERLFERYYRVKGNHNISGFGIGLYLSAEIVELHNGHIWVESKQGNGSTFYFSLPVA